MSLPGGRPCPSAAGATGPGPGPSTVGIVGYALAATAATSWGAQSIVAKLTSTLEPVVSGVVAFAVLGETLAWPQLAGGALVLTGIGLLHLRR